MSDIDIWICQACGNVFGIFVKCPACGAEKKRPVEQKYKLQEID